MSMVELREKKGERQGLLERIDLYRLGATGLLDQSKVGDMGQVMTPAPVARFMASLFDDSNRGDIRLLDAGAGVGSLSAAFVEEFYLRRRKPNLISITAYELESRLLEYLSTTFSECRDESNAAGVSFYGDIKKQDFIKEGVGLLSGRLFSGKGEDELFTHAILNPPYKKIRSDSKYRLLLRDIGVETSNLYAAFVTLAIKLLVHGGEIVAITPRSFCNGPYFRTFRKMLLSETRLCHLHVFDSRNETFKDDNVLQENIILHAIKDHHHRKVLVSASYGPSFESRTTRQVDSSQIVRSDDPDMFIHIATNELDQHVVDRMNCFKHTLKDLDLEVSTGRVVDFRSTENLRREPEPGTVPLIYPMHFHKGFIRWPKRAAKKPNAIMVTQETKNLLLTRGFYVVVRRFSSKEEYHRIVAALYEPDRVDTRSVAFENHVNYFHCNNSGLREEIAKGLAVYLNSSLVDIYFRQFNGNTQVNATDLRMLKYPSHEVLERIGKIVNEDFPTQEEIDQLIEDEVNKMGDIETPDPVKVKKKINEALDIIKSIGLPKGQHNERSALTLLALLNVKPKTKWKDAEARLIGITPIMDFCKNYYGREYAPNTRETFRRQTMHQFLAAGIVIENPDRPERPINSPKWCYKIESTKALDLIRSFRSKAWKKNLKIYLQTVETLKDRYAQKRKMDMIPVRIPGGKEIKLTPGRHNELVRKIINEFAPRFAPNGRVIYVGDTGSKWAYYDKEGLKKLGITAGTRGKMPDAILYYPEKKWIFLFEAVTSHGPIDGKRKEELDKIFESIKGRIVYVTAFLTRNEMGRYIGEISWETEVWTADAPTHLIHFDGVRFLGPYGRRESQ